MEKPEFENENLNLRVWWNTDGVQRLYYVHSIDEAIVVLTVLSRREMDDESIGYNASGLEERDSEGWSEWYNADGEDIQEYIAQLEEV